MELGRSGRSMMMSAGAGAVEGEGATGWSTTDGHRGTGNRRKQGDG
jgi:hypothetical protein